MFQIKKTPSIDRNPLKQNGIKDYDDQLPSKSYFGLLKDTKRNLNYISDIRLDANGKVSGGWIEKK